MARSPGRRTAVGRRGDEACRRRAIRLETGAGRRTPVKAVVDPNVLVSAAISSHGPPARLLEAAEEGRFELLSSSRLSDELQDVLRREKFRHYLPSEAVPTFVRRVGMIATFSEEGQIRPITQDPKDDYLVALAFNGKADFLISGDAHLLALDEAAGLEGHTVRVLTPREFLQELG